MGLRLETYKLSELNKISGRGGAVPALFWWLPIGRWSEQQLWRVWSQFVDERDSLCNRLGLALIKEPGHRAEGGSHDVSALAGRLSELVPEGSSFEGYAERDGEQGQFLLLSGAYPQPGWGLLVSGSATALDLEEMVAAALSRPDTNGVADVEPIIAAAAAYHERQRAGQLRASTQQRDDLEKDSVRLKALGSCLKDLSAQLASGNFEELGAARMRLKQQAPDLAGVALLDDREFNALKLDHKLQGIADEQERHAIQEMLAGLQAKRAAGEEIKPKMITQSGMGQVIKPWLQAADLAPAPEKLFEQTGLRYHEREARLRLEVDTVLGSIQAELGRVQLELAQATERLDQARHAQDRQRTEAETRFRTSLIDAVQVQTEWGTRFLVEFESVCRAKGTPCANIAWDPARMIGWKLWARGAELRLEDLYSAASEMASGSDGFERIGDPGNLSNGSLFTDYVHHIAYSDLKRTPREVTVAMVEKLRVSERRQILERQLGATPRTSTQPVTAEELVTALGWPEERAKTKVPLAATPAAQGKGLREGIDGNVLRIILESYCKDVIDLVSNELGDSDEDIYARVQRAVPAYRPGGNSWSEEVAHITLGSAALVLEALLPHAFPTDNESTRALLSGIRKLSALLNPESHDREGSTVAAFDGKAAAALVQQLLDHSNRLLGELPWHFKALQTTGRQPQVLTGTAWSHSHPEQRSLRIMLWTGEKLDQDALIWNKERINPIITNPRIIRRPGRNR